MHYPTCFHFKTGWAFLCLPQRQEGGEVETDSVALRNSYTSDGRRYVCVSQNRRAHAGEKACQKSFNILVQRTNYKGICDPSENLRKEENETKEEATGE